MRIIFGVIIAATVGSSAIIGAKAYSDAVKRKEEYRREQIKLLSNGVEIKVDKDVVDDAINTTVDRVVTHEVKAACTTAVFKVKADIHKDVKEAVEAAYSDIEDDVKREIEKQIRNIDIADTRKEVIKKAKERVAEKFEEDLDGVLDKYNRDLENISKIYSSIAKSVSKDEKTLALKIE